MLGAVIVVCAGDLSRAEDATNDAFVKAFERWDRVAPMSSQRAWVTKVAINNAKRSFLHRARQISLVNTELPATLSQARSKLRTELEGEVL